MGTTMQRRGRSKWRAPGAIVLSCSIGGAAGCTADYDEAGRAVAEAAPHAGDGVSDFFNCLLANCTRCSEGCPYDRPVCDDDGFCWACVKDSDCAVGEACINTWTGRACTPRDSRPCSLDYAWQGCRSELDCPAHHACLLDDATCTGGCVSTQQLDAGAEDAQAEQRDAGPAHDAAGHADAASAVDAADLVPDGGEHDSQADSATPANTFDAGLIQADGAISDLGGPP